MPRLIWSTRALSDLQHLYRFLAAVNQEAASRAVATIRISVKMLLEHPEIGRPVDDMSPEYREWPIAFGISGYVARYHFDGKQAVLLAIRHQRELS